MGLARVVTFDGVDTDRIEQLRKDMAEGEPPEGLPVKEGIVLHDAENGKAMAILFFDSEDDYQQGDATLNSMPAGDTPGRRTSVTKYEVAIRMTA